MESGFEEDRLSIALPAQIATTNAAAAAAQSIQRFLLGAIAPATRAIAASTAAGVVDCTVMACEPSTRVSAATAEVADVFAGAAPAAAASAEVLNAATREPVFVPAIKLSLAAGTISGSASAAAISLPV